MKIRAVDIYRFCIPFVAPVRVGQKVLDVREGFILALTDDHGRTGYGEIAPLPGLDETPLDKCLRDLPALRRRFIDATLDADRFEVAAPLLGIASFSAQDLPSLTTHTWFGVECALLGLVLQQMTDASRLMYPLRIGVNGLFMPDQGRESVARQISELKKQKMKTIKVKIGRMAVDEEIRQILDLAAKLGTEVTLRLDGNRSLTPELYTHYYDALRHLPVEYIEEPLINADLASAKDLRWPVALDESLADLLDPEDPRPSFLDSAIRAIILKPGRLAGLHAMGGCVADANRAGIKTVFSSSFNTGVTLFALGVFSRLAALAPQTAHGLDTLRYLSTDILTVSPCICDGQLVIPESFARGGQRLNKALLHREDDL